MTCWRGWVARSIPVACPIATTDGPTVVEYDGALWALFPWIDGTPPSRGALTGPQARAAGEMHGRIHRVLAEYPRPVQSPPMLDLDTPKAIEQLGTIIDAAVDQQAQGWILDGLRWQRSLLRRRGHAMSEPAELTTGLSHGDHHDQQLLFDEHDRLVAVADWEIFGVRPLAYEVIRSLWFSQVMELPVMADYLAGYREHVPLTEAEWRVSLDFWWQGRLHSTWVFQESFLGANKRVEQFFPESFRVLRVLADEEGRAALAERVVRAASG